MKASASAAPASGLNENFTVRKISYGEGVERVFPLYSPMIDSIKVVRRGQVRRAKLYYLRGRRGKSARIVERQDHSAQGEGAARPRRRSNHSLRGSTGLCRMSNVRYIVTMAIAMLPILNVDFRHAGARQLAPLCLKSFGQRVGDPFGLLGRKVGFVPQRPGELKRIEWHGGHVAKSYH